jgi:tetratricopeptide (TPR) repeat protein
VGSAFRRIVAALLVVAIAATVLGGQALETSVAILSQTLNRPTPLRDGIGSASEAVTTSSDRARAYYNQGLAYLHSFVWIEAARSFNEASRADPSMPMAHLGMSYALGELHDSDGAQRAVRAAQKLAAKVSQRERVRIDLRVKQLEAGARRSDTSLQAAYRSALDVASTNYPDDVEVLLLVGQAQEPGHAAHGMGAGSASLRFYRRALERQPEYFATHHYLIHAYENVREFDAALTHAAAYVRLAPSIPHAHHMHGHVLRRSGRLKEAVAEFRAAAELDTEYQRIEMIPASLNWHYRHNLDLLGALHLYQGQHRLAEPILRRSFETASAGPAAENLNRRTWPMFLLSRGRHEEALAAVNLLVSNQAPLVRALGHLLRSRVRQARNDLKAAAEDGNAGLRLMKASGALGGLLLPDFQLAQGEYLLRTGQTEQGRAMLRDAASKLRAANAPDAWTDSLVALELLTHTAWNLGDWTLADALSMELASHAREYAGASYALGRVREHSGVSSAARMFYAEAIKRWPDAEPDLPALADARRRLAGLP